MEPLYDAYTTYLPEIRDKKRNRNALSSEVKNSVVIQSNPFTFCN